MQTLSTPSIHAGRGGGRIASDRYRQSLQLCDDFTGLEETTNRYDLLLLVKRTGKLAGFTPRMIQLLDYYMAFTRDVDWMEGSRPIVYQSVSRTALDLGVSERQIQKLEKRLFEIGASTWQDCGNHKRYGKRDVDTGRIVFAFGVDLTPLAYLKADLEDKLHEKQLYEQAWLDSKRQISWYRRQIRSMLLEWEEGACAEDLSSYAQAYDGIAVQIRTHLRLEELRGLLAQHEELHAELLGMVSVKSASSQADLQAEVCRGKSQESSCTSEPEFAHKEYINLIKKPCSPGEQDCFQKSVVASAGPEDLILSTGMQHITLKQVLLCASDRFREYMPLESRPMNWNDIVSAAYQLRGDLQIGQQAWGEACQLLGRVGASLCLLLTDNATQRSENQVAHSAAYFRGMIKKGRVGELKLHSSIFGLLVSQRQTSASNSSVYGVEKRGSLANSADF